MTTERARLTGRLGRKSPSGLEAPQAALLLQLAFLLLPGVHGWHNAGARSQLGRTSRQNVCWNGPGLDWGGQPWDQLGQDKIPKPPAGVGVEHNVFVAGEGCRRCVVGTTCTFQLRFASSKLFDTSIMLYHEIMITLHGPALVHAYAVPHGGLLRGERTVNYHVSYKAWDAGNYTVAIQGDCSRDGGKVGSHQLAAFPVVVEEPSDATSGAGGLVGGQEQAEGEGFWAKLMQARKRLTGNTPGGVATDAVRPGQQGTESAGAAEQQQPQQQQLQGLGGVGGDDGSHDDGDEYAASPCDEGQWGRWKRQEGVATDHTAGQGSGKGYEWAWYECGPAVEPVEHAVLALNARGVREISFVGDSHQRGLFKYMQQMLTGKVDSRGFHDNMFWTHRNAATNASLQLNFYWLGGIYTNQDKNCNRDPKEFKGYPTVPATSDVVVIEGAHWSFQRCVRPESSYAEHLPHLLAWFGAMKRKPTTRVFWRSSPPFPVKHFECKQERNSGIAWANDFARSLVQRFDMEFLDFWPIEATRYEDACMTEDPEGKATQDFHYSCEYANHEHMRGVVGEIITRNFIRSLLVL